jgi:hypothetical protein
MDDLELDANLSARSAALADSADEQLRRIPLLLLLAQCLSSSQSLTDAVRHPELPADRVAAALRSIELEDPADAYFEAAAVAPPPHIHIDDVDFKEWPGKQEYLALRSDFEQLAGEITRRAYELARQRWMEISPLPANLHVLNEFEALQKRLRTR